MDVREQGPFVIKVEMWYESPDDPMDLEWCGEFLWGVEFMRGPTLIFDHPGEALLCISQHSIPSDISGFEYRYRVVQDKSKKMSLPF